MRADEPDIDDAIRIIDPHHDAILVADNVEHRTALVPAGASRRIRGSHTFRDLGAPFTLDDSNVVLTLQIKPELGTISKISAKPDGRICGDRPASIEYVRDATGRYAKIECEPICAELAHF